MNPARVYQLRHDLVIRRRVFGESVKYLVKDPQRLEYYTIDEWTYQLLSLCDGHRDLGALSAAARERLPDMDLNPLTILEFCETYRRFHFFEDSWERNILLIEQRRGSRLKRLRKAFANPLEIHLPAWDPDLFFSRIVRPLGFLYTRSALVVYATLILLAIWLSATHADEFALSFRELWVIPGKTGLGLIALWAALLLTVVMHEVGHGLTCKHYGGGVHKIGFLLLYFNPCMFCDVTESYFFDDRRKKHAVTLAGGLVDLLTAAAATFVWYFTVPDLFLNAVAHRVAIFNGVTGILVNYNPLMKYDGYFLFSDQLGIPNMRGESFHFLGNRVRGLLRLPHEEELVSARERRIFWIYGICAFAYSVFVLWFVLRFVGGWLVHLLRGAGYVLTAALLFLMTKGYSRRLFGFARFVALDKGGHFRRYRVPYLAGLAATLAALFLLPVPRHVRGEFVLHPGSEVVVRAEVTGVIESVHADEGDRVAAASTPVVLRAENVILGVEEARSLRQSAGAQRAAAQVAGEPAAAVAAAARMTAGQALEHYYRSREVYLRPPAPISGIVLTPRLRERVGLAYVPGDTLYVVGELGTLRAEVLLDERDMGLLTPDQPVELRTRATAGQRLLGHIEQISQEPSALRTRPLYRVVVRVENPEEICRPGQEGVARFAAGRLSLIGHALSGLARTFRIEFWV